ncbi:MAG: penicillin-binding protein 2 [bacterium]|nr:penicillin-binding protein 2 [bacterium]
MAVNKKFEGRVKVLRTVFAIVLAFFFYKQFVLQHINTDPYLFAADSYHLGANKEQAVRGDIRDRNNVVLATSCKRRNICVHPDQIKDPEFLAGAISEILGRDKDKLCKELRGAMMLRRPFMYIEKNAPDYACDELIRRRSEIIDAAEKAFYLRKKNEGKSLSWQLLIDALRGKGKEVFKADDVDPFLGLEIEREPAGMRFYPKGRLASHIIGFAGDEGKGLEGIEAQYDDILSGHHGNSLSVFDAGGNVIPLAAEKLHTDKNDESGASKAPEKNLFGQKRDGSTIYLTIDERIQHIVEETIANTVNEFKAKGATCVVLDPKTAKVLAMAVYPDYNPRDVRNITDKSIMRNRAIADIYEPGSIFKVLLMGAALHSGVKPGDIFDNPNVYMAGGEPINNANDGIGANPIESMANILAYSFNTGSAVIERKIGDKAFYDTLNEFGIGDPTDVGLLGETYGSLKSYPFWNEKENRPDWAPGDSARIAFGQSVDVTPMQMASAMQAIANKGVRLQPSIIDKIVDDDGTVHEQQPKVVGRPLTEKQAEDLKGMLAGVIAFGTGKQARVPGYYVGGKTGTADILCGPGAGQCNAGFIGIAPLDDPKLVMVVKIEQPGTVRWGGVVAAPVFSRICVKALPILGAVPTPGYVQDFTEGHTR